MSTTISRRDAILGLASAALMPLQTTKWIQDKKKPVGWAVLGLGSYAQYQIMPSFRDCTDSKLVALISGHPDKLTRLGERYGIPEKSRYTYDQMDAIASNPEIDVVYVITPPGTHPEFTARAAALGKHVHCEKPMAPTAADCQRMIDACKKAKKLLQIGYRCHFETHNLRAIQAFHSGELGKITALRSDHGFSIGRGLWRTQKALAGGGSMMDIGIYSLQALRYLSGEEPIEVSATITNPPNDDRFTEVEDTVDFTLKFKSGLVGHGTSGYSWMPGKNRYEIVGEKGTLLAEPATSYGGDRLSVNGVEIPVQSNNQFAAMMDSFSQAVRDHTKVKAPGEEGKRDIHIIECIYESAKTGKPVKV